MSDYLHPMRRVYMAIHYVCRHCGHALGSIDQKLVTEESLGFHHLTHAERESMITYREDGDLQANVICEHCQETINRHPELLLQSSILQ